MTSTSTSTLEWCDWIVSEGIGKLVPLPTGEKFPPPTGSTGKSKPSADSPRWPAWERAARKVHELCDANIGVVLNDGYVAIDLDTKDDNSLDADYGVSMKFGNIGHPMNTTSNRNGHGHYIYKANSADFENVTGKLAYGYGDFIRPTHRYICTGGGYTKWIPDRIEWLPPQVDRMVQRKRVRTHTPRRSTASEADVMRYIRNERKLPNGARNDGMCRIAGAIVNRGGTYRDLQINNEMLCQPPLADAELARIWESISGRKS